MLGPWRNFMQQGFEIYRRVLRSCLNWSMRPMWWSMVSIYQCKSEINILEKYVAAFTMSLFRVTNFGHVFPCIAFVLMERCSFILYLASRTKQLLVLGPIKWFPIWDGHYRNCRTVVVWKSPRTHHQSWNTVRLGEPGKVHRTGETNTFVIWIIYWDF